MIARLIDLCLQNRVMVLLLTAALVAAGAWSATRLTVDAIPDLSDVQVVIRTAYPGQAPQIVEDQVTYPLTTAMLAVPGAETVRGYSMFGDSYVYVIFEDGTDLYWARSRTLEQLSTVAGRLPAGVTPQLGPDATGVGWVYEYALVTGPWCLEHPDGLWTDPDTGAWYASPADAPADAPEAARERLTHSRVFPDHEVCPLDGTPLALPGVDLAGLRSLQDWYLRYELTSAPGVSEVASVGGFVKQYQVVIDPVRLLAYDLSIADVEAAIQAANRDIGGSVIERSETEFMVRGLGYLGTPSDSDKAHDRTQQVLDDLRTTALRTTSAGSPVYLRDVATVRLGPEMRRGILEWNGEGETVGGIVVMRSGENARDTIEAVRHKLATLEAGLPPGVAIRTGYDRSDLIDRAMETLSHTLIEEILVVALTITLFLLHVRSALVAACVLPAGVLISLLIMYGVGLNANIMSLGGIAIAIGVMVDSSIIMVENVHKHMERRKAEGGSAKEEEATHAPPESSDTSAFSAADHWAVVSAASREVGPSLFFSLLIITVSFLPVFVLGGQSGRLFAPLAYTKTFAMGVAAVLAVTVLPVLMGYLVRERTVPRGWPKWVRWTGYGAIILLPALLLAFVPLPRLGDYRAWMVVGWVVLSAAILLPQRLVTEERNPLSALLERLYNPAFALVMRFKLTTVLVASIILAATLLPLVGVRALAPGVADRLPGLAAAFPGLGSEFMPPMEEGDLLYMPTTIEPGLSTTKAREILQQTDKILMRFPEVQSVLGKIGRADTATDPAPMNMIETTITLHRDPRKWRHVPVERFFSDWPAPLRWLPSKLLAQSRPITTQELVYGFHLPDASGGGTAVPGMNEALQIPGLANAWTMPIRTRIDMLSTGIRTPVGVKVLGPDLAVLADLSRRIEVALKTDERTASFTTSAFSEKTVGGKYLDIRIDREAIARHGLSIDAVQGVIATAVGGMSVTSTVEGLERYPVSLRYPAELRDSLPELQQVLVPTPTGAHIPLGQLATFETRLGPPMIRSENARPASLVYIDIAGIDVGTYVARAQAAVAETVRLPAGYSLVWSGQYEYMQQARQRLTVAIPLAAVAILLLLYMATRSWLRVGVVLLALPFSLVGAFWYLYFLDYNLSLAVWVGIIALAGLDAETGLIMLLYLDNSFERFRAEGRMRNANDLWWAVHDGAVKRIRPKTMTVVTTFVGLVPLMWAGGAGADTMRRLAAPMIGGLASSFLLELLLYPVLFYLAKRASLFRTFRAPGPAA